MKKRFLVCGNWKLHHSLLETKQWIQGALPHLSHCKDVDVAIAPVVTTLFAACEQAKASSLQIAAQHVGFHPKGAYTGDWSAMHLRELGCQMALIGHSERRHYFGETNETVAKRVEHCLHHEVVPIVCIGESLKEREQGLLKQILSEQMQRWLPLLLQHSTKVIVAYEPVWAIGTGKTPNKQEIEEAHSWIFGTLVSACGMNQAQSVRILYGGSVKPENAKEISAIPHVDGLLVGGASLSVESFFKIVLATKV